MRHEESHVHDVIAITNNVAAAFNHKWYYCTSLQVTHRSNPSKREKVKRTNGTTRFGTYAVTLLPRFYVWT